METIPIKYKIPKLNYSAPSTFPITYSVYIKLKGSPDASYELFTDNFQCDVNGNNTNNWSFSNVVENAEYTIKIVNNADVSKFLIMDYRTCINMSNGDNPLFKKKYYLGQTIDWFEPNLLQSTLPNLNGGFFFTYDSNYRESDQSFGNMVPTEGTTFKAVTDIGVTTRKLNGLYFNGSNYVKFNDVNANLAGRIRSDVLFGDNSDVSYSMMFFLFLEDLTDKVIMETYEDVNNWFKLRLTSSTLYVEVRKNGVTQIANSKYNVEANKWYLFDLRVDLGNPTNNVGILYHPQGNINFNNISNITHNMITSSKNPVYLGRDPIAEVNYGNFIISRFYFAPTTTFSNYDLYRIQDPWGFIPKVQFSPVADPNTIYTVTSDNINKFDNTKLSFILTEGFLSPGLYNGWILNGNGNKLHQLNNLEIMAFVKDTVGFDIDFTTGVFADKLAEFKNTFYGFHGQWGGANGGVNSNLIYGNANNKSIVFECHGDLYDGEVQGVSKVAKDGTLTAYGEPKFHDVPADPKYLQAWKTRTGAVAVSQKYCGYGEWSTWMKIPVGAYGVAPALWFFHYQEIYPNNSRWQYWIDRGAKPYGGNDPYMVINHEIDIELPSHIAQGVFTTWAELALAYFDPLVIDNKIHCAVEQDVDNANIGLFRLDNPLQPNLRASWTKVSDTWKPVNQPSMNNIKFNNWIGEKSSGSGWGYDQVTYEEGEEYVAKLTKTDTNYADGQFHKWTIKWYKDRTELWIDDVFVRENKGFVPFIPGRLTIGPWFPSGVSQNDESYWDYSPGRAWAGYPANFKTMNVEVSRISFIPYDNTTAGGDNEYFSESFPETSLRTIL